MTGAFFTICLRVEVVFLQKDAVTIESASCSRGECSHVKCNEC